MTTAQRRRRRAWKLASNAYRRSGISSYHATRDAFMRTMKEAIEKRLKREEHLHSLIRWYEDEISRLKSVKA